MAADIHAAAAKKRMVKEKHRACRTPCQVRGHDRRWAEEIVAAKTDGRWQAAYNSFGSASIPDDFIKLIAGNKKAKAFFETLNKTNLYSIAYRLQTAKKPETREKRMQAIIEMSRAARNFTECVA